MMLDDEPFDNLQISPIEPPGERQTNNAEPDFGDVPVPSNVYVGWLLAVASEKEESIGSNPQDGSRDRKVSRTTPNDYSQCHNGSPIQRQSALVSRALRKINAPADGCAIFLPARSTTMREPHQTWVKFGHVIAQAQRLDEVMLLLGIDSLAAARMEQGAAFARARRRCAECRCERQCGRWLEASIWRRLPTTTSRR